MSRYLARSTRHAIKQCQQVVGIYHGIQFRTSFRAEDHSPHVKLVVLVGVGSDFGEPFKVKRDDPLAPRIHLDSSHLAFDQRPLDDDIIRVRLQNSREWLPRCFQPLLPG
jgi:hypothetical protein